LHCVTWKCQFKKWKINKAFILKIINSSNKICEYKNNEMACRILKRLSFYKNKINLYRYGLSYVKSSYLTTVSNNFQQENVTYLKFSHNNYCTQPNKFIKNKTKTILELLEDIKSESATKLRVNYLTMNNIVSQLGSEPMTMDDVIFLLKCCAYNLPDTQHSERQVLVDQICDFVNKSLQPTQEFYTVLLMTTRKNKDELKDFKLFLKDLKCSPNEEIYQQLLYNAAEFGNISQAMDILAEMKKANLPLTENVFNALILAHSRNKDIKSCQLILDTMNAANLSPSALTYTELIRANIENGNNSAASQLLKETGQLLNDKMVLSIIRSIAFKDADPELLSLSYTFLSTEILLNNAIDPKIRNICTELIFSGQPRKALNIIKCLPIPIYQMNEDTDVQGTSLINDIIKADGLLAELLVVCNSLINSNRNTRALHIACEIALRRNKDIAKDLLLALHKSESLRIHYFWPLLIDAYKVNGETGLLNVVKLMGSLNIEFDYDTLRFYILPKLPITMKDARNGIQILSNNSIKMSNLATPLVSYLMYHQRFNDITDTISLYQAKLDTEEFIMPLLQIYMNPKIPNKPKFISKLLKLFNEKRLNENFDFASQFVMEVVSYNKTETSYESVSSILEEFSLLNIKLSTFVVDMVRQFFAQCDDVNMRKDVEISLRAIVDKAMNSPSTDFLGKHLTHPRDMTLEELECHLIELEGKEMNIRGVLRRLLQLSVREEKFDRALDIYQKCLTTGVDQSPGMLASVFELFIKTKNVDKAAEILTKLEKAYPSFSLDEHKVIDYACLLVENNRSADAKKQLERRAAASNPKGGNQCLKNIWKLLTCIAEQNINNKTTNETLKMLEFLVAKGYTGYHNTLLGPVIREHILKGQVKEAIKQFKLYGIKFKKTPLQLELLILLINISNGTYDGATDVTGEESKQLISDVIGISSKIHGPSKANLQLIMALTDSGTESQLRKILISPDVRINPLDLLKNCEHFIKSGKIKPIVKLAKCSRGIRNVLKEEELYNLIINEFVIKNDYMAALNLYEMIIADDEYKVSREFTQNLIDLFDKNNLEIPSNVLIHAKSI